MNYLGNKSLYRLLKSTDEYDFVAFVMTPWHAHAFLAALKNIEDIENRVLKGIVMIQPHETNGWLINEGDFAKNKNSISIYRYYDEESIIDRLHSEIDGIIYYFGLKKRDKPHFYFFKPNGFRYPILASLQKSCGKNELVCAVSIDEGVGIYTNFNYDTLLSSLKTSIIARTSIKSKLFSIFKTFEVHIFKEKRLIEKGYYIDCNLLKIRDDKVCEPNGSMPKYFKNVIEDSSKDIVLNHGFDRNYVLINTQPMEEYSYSGEDIQLDILKQCIPIFQEAGYSVVLKPHPRERDIEKYKHLNILVLEYNSISQESLLCKIRKPEYIVSCCSTTLVSTHLFWGIKAISLTKLFINNGTILKSYEDIFYRFEVAFQKMLIFPDDFEQLREIVNHTRK